MREKREDLGKGKTEDLGKERAEGGSRKKINNFRINI